MSAKPSYLTVVLASVLACLAGILIGQRVLGPKASPRPPAKSRNVEPAPTPSARWQAIAGEEPDVSPEQRVTPQTVQALQEEMETLSEEKEQIQQQLSDFLNWLLTNYKGRYPLPEHLMAKLRLAPVTQDFSLDPDVATLLHITPPEETIINDAFSATKVFLDEMESSLMTIREERPDKVVVHIPAFGEEGELVREDLMLALEATLGPDRFDRFLEVSEEEMDSTFLSFGEKARTIVFEVVYPENEERPLLTIKDGWIAEDGEKRKVVSATQITVEDLPEEYLAYIDWLVDYEPTAVE